MQNLSNALFRKGSLEESRVEIEKASDIASRIPDQDLRKSIAATIEVKLGLLEEGLKNFDLARKSYLKAKSLAESVSAHGDNNVTSAATRTVGEAMHNLAALDLALGDYPDAVKGLLELRDWSRARRDLVTEYWCTFTLLVAYQELQKHREALALVPGLNALQQKSPDGSLRASVLMAASRSYYATGDLDEAAALLQKAGEFFAAQRMGNELAQALNGIGTMAMEQGKLDKAEAALAAALRGRRILNDRVGEAITLNVLADLAWRKDDVPQAIKNLEAAAAILENVSAPLTKARTLGSLGLVYQVQEDHERAASIFAPQLICCCVIGLQSVPRCLQ